MLYNNTVYNIDIYSNIRNTMKNLIASLVFIVLLFSGCGESDSTTIVPDSLGDNNITTLSDMSDDNTVHSDNTKIYYGVTMYEEPDSTFTQVDMLDEFTIYEKYDDYYRIIAITTADNGIQKLVLTKTFVNDEYGTDAKEAFDNVETSLDEKYSTGDMDYDICLGTSYVCQSDNYAYSLYRDERLKIKSYVNGEDIIGLQLTSSSNSIYDIDLKITYETQEFRDFKDQYDSDYSDGMVESL